MKTPLLGIVMAVAAAAQTYPVAGVVTDGVHNAPVERARVILSDESGGRHALTTGPMVDSPSPCRREVHPLCRTHGVAHRWTGAVGVGRLRLGPSSPVPARIPLTWHCAGTRRGDLRKVVDEQDEPVRMPRQLMRDGVFCGRRRILEADYATTTTAASTAWLPWPRELTIPWFTAKPWYAMADSSPDTGAIYPATYYTGATDIREAAPGNSQIRRRSKRPTFPCEPPPGSMCTCAVQDGPENDVVRAIRF